jgi:nucleotidyltransferase substrate binding protein (TIGR01987 family)
MPLELDSLRKSVTALNGVLARSNDTELMGGLDEITQEAIKAGAIQHFKICYELCWKFIKRWLEANVSPTSADGVTRRELFRLAAESRLIVDVDQWMRHHEARNLTSHTYDPVVAASVYLAAHDFARDAQRLLEALEARND